MECQKYPSGLEWVARTVNCLNLNCKSLYFSGENKFSGRILAG